MQDSGIAIKPSKRKHLGGFDNLTASGINGFETLLKLASKYRIEKTTTKTIQNGKRYLKTNYQMHCNTISYSQSKTHSFIFFIWCKQDMLKSETFNDSSDDFRKLIEAIYKIQSIIKYNENLDAVYDCNIAIKDFIEYIKHLVRDYNQVKLNLMLLTKLITILPFGCATLVKKSSLSNIVKARRNILVRKVWL